MKTEGGSVIFENGETKQEKKQEKSENLNLPPSVDRSLFNYVDEDNEDLTCAICSEAFIDPLTHSSCLNTFCRACVKDTTKCPYCRNDFNSDNSKLVPASRPLLNMLDKLKVKCKTCEKEMNRGDIMVHSKTCGSSMFFLYIDW